MPTDPSSTIQRNVFRFTLTFGLFVLAPLLIALGLFEQGWRRMLEREEREHLESIHLRLDRFVASLDPIARLQKRFDSFRRAVWASGKDPRSLMPLWHRCVRAWNMPFDVYLFDEQGKLITPRALPLKSRTLGQYFWNELLSLPNPPIWKTAYRDFYGSNLRHWIVRQQRTQLQVLHLGSKLGGLAWDHDPYSYNGGLVLAAWSLPKAWDLAEAAFLGPRPPSWPLIFVDGQGSMQRIGEATRSLAAGNNFFEVLPTLVRQAGESGITLQGRRWISVAAFEGTWYAGFPETANEHQSQRWMVLGLLAVLGIAGGRFCWRWIVRGRDRFVSLRVKLVGLFLYVLLIPAVGGIHLAVESWRDRETIEISEALSANAKALNQIDDAFSEESVRMQRKMRSLVTSDQMIRDPGSFQRRLIDMKNNGDFADLYIRDLSGNLLPHLSTPDLNQRSLNKFYAVFSKICMERAGLLKEGPRVNVEEAFLRQFIEEPSSGFGRLVDRPGEVIALKVADSSEFIYWTALPESLRPAAYLLAARQANVAVESFLNSNLLRQRSHGDGSIRTFAVRGIDREFFPASGYRHPQLRRLVRRTNTLGKNLQERISINGKWWLASTRLGRQLEGVTLLALYPEDIIRRRLDSLRASAAWVGFAALVIALLSGLVLADTFLIPVGALGDGISALRRRETRYRLQVPQKDEFGELASAFNALLENFGEVNEARIIQNELFPRTPVRIGEYRVHGISRPATQLGGDYFDVAELGPGKLFTLIGDVSGHGIAAALVMAMARALVARHGKAEVDPADVLADLNQVIHATVQRKRRLMTCAAIWIDTMTHEARVFGCGHPYPMLRRFSDGKMEPLKTKGFPLGATAGFRTTSTRFTLEPGDRLFLYTDGLGESLAEAGSDGFLHLMRHIGLRPIVPLEQACDDLLDTHPFMRTGKPQPDDFTVLIIERDLTPSG